MKNLKYKLTKFADYCLGSLQIFSKPLFLIWGSISYKVKGHHARRVIDELQAGDILLRRYDSYVTSWVIPGWWKHAGIYVGDNKVVHALGHGVVEEDILTFLRCDYVAIMRLPEKYQEFATTEIPKRARKYLGTPYDFSFDTGNDKHLYCTELVNACLFDCEEIKFKVKETGLFGKGAVLPDYLLDSGLELVYSTVGEQN